MDLCHLFLSFGSTGLNDYGYYGIHYDTVVEPTTELNCFCAFTPKAKAQKWTHAESMRRRGYMHIFCLKAECSVDGSNGAMRTTRLTWILRDSTRANDANLSFTRVEILALSREFPLMLNHLKNEKSLLARVTPVEYSLCFWGQCSFTSLEIESSESYFWNP